MGNSSSIKPKQAQSSSTIINIEPLENEELSDSIDFSNIPTNKIETHLKSLEDSISDYSSNQQSSDLALSSCYHNINCITNLPLKLKNLMDKDALSLRKEFADSLYNGLINNNNEDSYIPEDCSYSDM